MAYRALTDVLLGQSPAAHPGDTLPDTFTDTAGGQVPVDFDRLVEIGAAEKISERKAKAAEKAASKDETS